jgi:predicted SAM-dependent methyltransferase
MKLNLGCGYDKRPGFINVDGNKDIQPDVVLDLGAESLLSHFSPSEAEMIVANDIIEHLFHWQAISFLLEAYILLANDGILELRLPDFETIINYLMTSEEKITALFGGQDRPQGEQDSSLRRNHPEFYCHKFTYTKDSMRKELETIGFKVLYCETVGTNMVLTCMKGNKP